MIQGNGLHVYWINLRTPANSPLCFGCGVTASDHQDAKALLEQQAFPKWGSFDIEGVAEIDDMNALPIPKYVDFVPRLSGNFLKRGVWYPKTENDW